MPGLSIRRQTHELVFPRIDPEPAIGGKRRIQQSERMREPELFQHFDLASATTSNRGRGVLADPIHSEDRSLREGRWIKRAGRVGPVMLGEPQWAVRRQGGQLVAKGSRQV